MFKEDKPFPRPKAIKDWRTIAARYREAIDGWENGRWSDDQLICFNHAASLRCGDPVRLRKMQDQKTLEALRLADEIVELQEVVRVATDIASELRDAAYGADDVTLARRYALSQCLLAKGERSKVISVLSRIAGPTSGPSIG